MLKDIKKSSQSDIGKVEQEIRQSEIKKSYPPKVAWKDIVMRGIEREMVLVKLQLSKNCFTGKGLKVRLKYWNRW